MAWEKRKSRLYYYRAVRLPDGTRVKEYYGRGHSACAAALLLDRQRSAKCRQLKIIRDWKARTLEAESHLKQFHNGVFELVAAEMQAIGFYNPGSRGWRRFMQAEVVTKPLDSGEIVPVERGDDHGGAKPPRKGLLASHKDAESGSGLGHANSAALKRGSAIGRAKQTTTAMSRRETSSRTLAGGSGESVDESDDPGASSPSAKSVDEMSVEELREAAKGGSRSAIARLRPFMDKDASRHASLGCLNTRAMVKWFDAHYGDDLYQRDCLRRSVQDLRADLLKEGKSPLERLLVDEVVLCFLRSKYWIARETQSLGSEINPLVAEFTIEQSARSQKLWLKAMNALRDYRNLAVRRSRVYLPPVIDQPKQE